MAPGERGGRGYGYDYDEERVPPSPYPAHRRYPSYPADPPPHQDYPARRPAVYQDRHGWYDTQTGYQQPGYEQAGYQQAGYEQAGYQQPGYQQPGHDPGYWNGGSGYRDQRSYLPSGDGRSGAGYRYPNHEAYPPVDRADPGWSTSQFRAADHSAAVAPARSAGGHRPPVDGYAGQAGYAGQSGYAGRRPPGEPPGAARPGLAPPVPVSPEGEEQRGGGRRKRRLPLWQELPLLLVIAFCLAILIRSFLLQAFFIPSGSMEDTLVAGDRVLANKVVYNFREPDRGEIVVFQGTDAWAPLSVVDEDAGALSKIGRTFGDLVGVSRPGEKDYIKRVVGVPGDVVSCCDEDGRVLVNGQPIDEEYVIRDSPLTEVPDGVSDCRGRQFDDVVVRPGHMFVMGDHRQRSQDSRCQGQVPIDNVIGRAFVIVWPNDRWTGLSATDTFAEVPQPVAAPPAGSRPADSRPAEIQAAGPGNLGLVLPLLLPLGVARRRGTAPTLDRSPARSRRRRRNRGRRLAT